MMLKLINLSPIDISRVSRFYFAGTITTRGERVAFDVSRVSNKRGQQLEIFKSCGIISLIISLSGFYKYSTLFE